MTKLFLSGRKRHLEAKQTKTLLSLTANIPPRLREWKLTNELPAIHAALIRIEDGTYGTCMRCEEMIPEGRLLRLPDAPYCVECQRSFEARRDAHQSR